MVGVRTRYRGFLRRNFLSTSELIFLSGLFIMILALTIGMIFTFFDTIFGPDKTDHAAQECTQRGGVYIEGHCWRSELFLQLEEEQ